MAELRVRLLGGLAVEGFQPAEVGSRKARTLLAALAAHEGRPLAVETLADIVWGEDQPGRPYDQIGVLISRLRKAIGSDRIRRTDAGYALDADWIDTTELTLRAQAATDRLRAGDALSARMAATMALDLVRGALLPEEDGEWLDALRASVERTIASVRGIAAEAALDAGDLLGAVAAAGSALDADPYDEAALRTLMRAHVALGRPASALAAYAELRARLLEDLGAAPTTLTEDLHGAVLRGEALPARNGSAAASGGSVEADPAATARPDAWDPQVERARHELASSDFAAARADAEGALGRARSPGALELRGWVAYYERDLPSALRLAEEAAQHAGDDERRASSLTLAGRARHSRGDLSLAEAHLLEARGSDVPGVRAMAEVWLGSLRVHQGRADEGLRLVDQGAVDAAAMRHPFVIPHALLMRTYALGMRGEVARALASSDRCSEALDHLGPAGERFRSSHANFRGWLLGAIGRREESEALHLEAMRSTGRFEEPRVQAVLDLAMLALDAGDADTAAGWLEHVEMATDDRGSMVWHQRHRYGLLGARLALLRGDARRAREQAEMVVVDSLARGTLRHGLQGTVVSLCARACDGEDLDAHQLADTLERLDAVLGLEAWRRSADLAAATRSDELWGAARRRGELLAVASGDDAAEVRSWIGAELSRLGAP